MNYNALKNINIEKNETTGQDKLIRTKKFIDEFREYCLLKPLKLIFKLNHLKAYVSGNA